MSSESKATATTTSTAAAGAAPPATEPHEDDQFEDFDEEWESLAVDPEDAKQWVENWEDEEVNVDFVAQLRVELQKTAAR